MRRASVFHFCIERTIFISSPLRIAGLEMYGGRSQLEFLGFESPPVKQLI